MDNTCKMFIYNTNVFLTFFHQDHITETIQKHIIENQTPGIKGK